MRWPNSLRKIGFKLLSTVGSSMSVHQIKSFIILAVIRNTVSDLTGPRFEPLTSRSRDERVTARPTGRFNESPWHSKLKSVKIQLPIKN